MRWRLLLGFLLTDETFAVVDNHCRQHAPSPTLRWYFLGSGLTMYINWQIWTLVGLFFGALFPQLQSLGLDFAMVVTFIAIVVPQLKRLHFLGAALVARSEERSVGNAGVWTGRSRWSRYHEHKTKLN